MPHETIKYKLKLLEEKSVLNIQIRKNLNVLSYKKVVIKFFDIF